MRVNSLELRCEKRGYSQKIDFALVTYNRAGTRHVAEPVTMHEQGDEPITQPTFSLEQDEAQLLFNELWALGLRPTDGTGNSGHVEALKNHLEDMRTLVFQK